MFGEYNQQFSNEKPEYKFGNIFKIKSLKKQLTKAAEQEVEQAKAEIQVAVLKDTMDVQKQTAAKLMEGLGQNINKIA